MKKCFFPLHSGEDWTFYISSRNCKIKATCLFYVCNNCILMDWMVVFSSTCCECNSLYFWGRTGLLLHWQIQQQLVNSPEWN
jgi:hypothetical protein